MWNTGICVNLEINKQKSYFIIFNLKRKPFKIVNISVKDQMKYLGITINNRRNCFKINEKVIIEKATKLANMTYSDTERSCAKLLVWKTY